MLLRNEQQLALNQVERVCIATADQYATAAASSEDEALSRLFDELARQRTELAAELADHVRALDDLPQQPDPDRETVNHLITSIKAFFSEDERDTLIKERKKLELNLAEAAQAALQQALPEKTKLFLQQLLSHVDATLRQLDLARRRD